MRFFFIISLCLFIQGYVLAADKLRQSAWQQRVDYEIEVELHPDNKELDAHIRMHYFNNSPDTLYTIWMHVWPNAYSDNNTAFARQQLNDGETDFYYSQAKDRGFINGLDFRQDGGQISWEADSANADIIRLKLQRPLLPGTSMFITTPFKVKLPKIFSRSGFQDDFFSVTQWYPKPAVYDVNGWHPMPYLNQGEFYSEYGNYLVNMTVPGNYVVASTGHMTGKQDTILNSSAAVRYTYAENNIHDFAWFASPGLKLNNRTTSIEGNDSILLSVYMYGDVVNKEKHAPIHYLEQAIQEYSKRVGTYPYKTCSVVIGPLLAGGGMEYPTITICSSTDASTIIHEVGHNWFYGILGSNERQYPWMDESINTFYEQLISEKLKEDNAFFKKKISLKQWAQDYMDQLVYMFSARQGLSQPLNMAAADFTRLNYGAIVYSKGPLLFAYLRQQLGDSVFTKCARNYFDTWKYKHPLPGDMHHSFESSSGMDLDWFFIDLLNEDNEIDIIKTKNGFKVKGSGKLDSFLHKRGYANANPYGFLPETNYRNNYGGKKLISIGIPISAPKNHALVNINVSPIAGFNYYDKWYLGGLIYNRSVLRNKLEYMLMPAYAFGSDKPVGYGKINKLIVLHNRHIYKIETGVQGHSFNQMVSSELNQYYRIAPYINIHFKHHGKLSDLIDKQLSLNFYHTGLNKDYTSYRDSNNMEHRTQLPVSYFFNYLKMSYTIENRHPVNAYRLQLSSEYGYNYKYNPSANDYLKAWINASYTYGFPNKNKFFRTELFAGVFLHKKGNTGLQQFYLSANSGKLDYLYNQAMLGRNEDVFSNNLLGRQLIHTNGNMRNLIPTPGTDRWMLALNNEISLPGIIPFRIYADIGFYPYVETVNTAGGVVTTLKKPEFYTTAGFTLPLFKGMLEIFVPVYQTDQFKGIYKFKGFNVGDVIGFKLQLNKLDLFKMIDNNRLY